MKGCYCLVLFVLGLLYVWMLFYGCFGLFLRVFGPRKLQSTFISEFLGFLFDGILSGFIFGVFCWFFGSRFSLKEERGERFSFCFLLKKFLFCFSFVSL